jgi:hypothetical protein
MSSGDSFMVNLNEVTDDGIFVGARDLDGAVLFNFEGREVSILIGGKSTVVPGSFEKLLGRFDPEEALQPLFSGGSICQMETNTTFEEVQVFLIPTGCHADAGEASVRASMINSILAPRLFLAEGVSLEADETSRARKAHYLPKACILREADSVEGWGDADLHTQALLRIEDRFAPGLEEPAIRAILRDVQRLNAERDSRLLARVVEWTQQADDSCKLVVDGGRAHVVHPDILKFLRTEKVPYCAVTVGLSAEGKRIMDRSKKGCAAVRDYYGV